MSDAPLKAGALFSGIGGFCLGFAQAGIPTSWAVEIDDYANTTYRNFAPDTRLINTDIKQVLNRAGFAGGWFH